jgi:hypothetical protein
MRVAYLAHVAALLALAAATPIACSDAAESDDEVLGPEDGGDGLEPGAGAGADPSGGGDDPSQPKPPDCDGPLGKPQDPKSLPECCPEQPGTAHCVAQVSEKLGKLFGPCTGGGSCVADDFIVTGGVFEPKSCASIAGAPGACISKCAPKVAEKADILPQDVCAPHEACVPCVHPVDGTDTGACQLGFKCGDDPGGSTSTGSGPATAPTCPYEGPPIIDPKTLPACASCSGGHCVDNAKIPATMKSKLAACNATSMCVPDKAIETAGNFIPASCKSLAGAEGRCLSTCLPDVAAKQDTLPVSSCAPDQRCVPCFDPVSGDDTGACQLSCDPGPKEPPTVLPSCCNEIGTCVPKEAVPASKAEQLGEDSCSQTGGAMLCVPDVYLTPGAVPQACETSWLSFLLGSTYKPGACVADCMPGVGGWLNDLVLKQDGCPEHFVCAPCTKPLSGGKPSGACAGLDTCSGKCGGQTAAGCWCDTECVKYGDCCADACQLCGSC